MTGNQVSQSDSVPVPGAPPADTGAPRIGVYVCHCGGNISDVVDVEAVVRAATMWHGVAVARRHMFMCSDPGQEMIAEDIRAYELDRVVVAACSPSLHEITFRRTLARAGLNRYMYEHVNLREQVSWCSGSDPSGATDKAIRLVRAAVAKARLLRPLESISVDAAPRALVVGAGIAGLRAASDLARLGLSVVLLERSPFLGGRIRQLNALYPTRDDGRETLHRLVDEVTDNPDVTIHTQAEVTAVSGYVGNFQVEVLMHPRGVDAGLAPEQFRAAAEACPVTVGNDFDHGLTRRKAIYLPYPQARPSVPAIDWKRCTRCGRCAEAVEDGRIDLQSQPVKQTLSAGAIVVATGFGLYEPRRGEYGYDDLSEVITLPQLIRILDPAGPTGGRLQHNGRPARNVCFIHCVGSRQLPGVHPPNANGRLNEHCSRVCCTATLQAAIEIRERFPDVNVFEVYQDIRTYGRGHEDIYEEACRRGVVFMRYGPEEPPTVSQPDGSRNDGAVVVVRDTLTFGEELEVHADLVVLSVGIVPRENAGLIDALKLPRSGDGFLQEVHPKLRPVESSVAGVLIAGACQAPMDVTESCAAASAAAVKAAALLSQGIELDPFVARIDPAKCRGEGKCAEECGREAITVVEKDVDGTPVRHAEVNTALCSGCGMCVAVCPHGAIEVEGWRLDQFRAMVNALLADELQPETADV